MIPHDALISAKVVMLQHLVGEILIDRFLQFPDPIDSVEKYASARRQAPVRPDADPDADLIYEAVWGEFLDRVVSAVKKQTGG
jgi:hypothetical protein